jgi:Transposase zinc-ribbon domain
MTDAGFYAASWRDRSRRMFVFKSAQIAFIPIIIGAAFLSARSSLVLLAIPLWLVVYLASAVWLNRFKCPRCGKLYYWRLERKGYLERQRKWRDCRHCGLHQDAEPA